ncbi:hypothetical protein R3P38DRAFT_3531795 [Favolaschia claudopus]|uniref:Uncharacterized protein n=1 Tax=Favolaschia claudopus TaxID=2862362 RepID=A0AAW0BJ02_9AGAR
MPTEHNIIPGGRSHKTLAIGGTGRPLVWRDLWLKPVGPDHHVKHDVRGKFSSPRQKSPVSTSPPTLSCMRTSRQSRPMDFRGRRYRRNTTLEHGRNGDREIGTYSALIRSAHIQNASWRSAQRYRLKRGGRGNHGAIGTVLADPVGTHPESARLARRPKWEARKREAEKISDQYSPYGAACIATSELLLSPSIIVNSTR